LIQARNQWVVAAGSVDGHKVISVSGGIYCTFPWYLWKWDINGGESYL